MNPPAPVSGEISVEMPRMPVGRIAAMKPEPLALTSFCSRIGSPAMKGARTIEPAISWIASALPARVMRLPLVLDAGQACHCRSSGLTAGRAEVGFCDENFSRRQLRNRLDRARAWCPFPRAR